MGSPFEYRQRTKKTLSIKTVKVIYDKRSYDTNGRKT